MKKNIGKYEEVNKLSQNAMTVKDYAELRNVSTSYIYKLVREKKNDFKLVTFKTVNFIIP